MVNEGIQDLKLLEKDIDAPTSFGGNHDKLLVNISTLAIIHVYGVWDFDLWYLVWCMV